MAGGGRVGGGRDILTPTFTTHPPIAMDAGPLSTGPDITPQNTLATTAQAEPFATHRLPRGAVKYHTIKLLDQVIHTPLQHLKMCCIH